MKKIFCILIAGLLMCSSLTTYAVKWGPDGPRWTAEDERAAERIREEEERKRKLEEDKVLDQSPNKLKSGKKVESLDIDKAIKDTKAQISNNKTNKVRFTNLNAIIAPENFKALHKTGFDLGYDIMLLFDTAFDGKIIRLYVDPETTTVEINPAANLERISKLNSLFSNNFKNDFVALSLMQTDSFGTTVKIAITAPKNFDLSQLQLYSYDFDTKKISYIGNIEIQESNGFFVFSTDLGGNFFIVDGALKK